MAKKTRLDKFLCDSLNMTRKEAKESVKKGKVVVNGEAIKKPEYKVDAEQDQVEFDHKLIQFEQFHYLMLHKPQGVVSATKDHHDQTVLDLIHEDYKDRLFPVGRLDKDTEGLLLLTDDGMLAHELLSPRKHVDKVYFAKVGIDRSLEITQEYKIVSVSTMIIFKNGKEVERIVGFIPKDQIKSKIKAHL